MPASGSPDTDRDSLVAQFEQLMEERRYEDARGVLAELLDKDPQDRVCQLYYLLDCMKLRGAAAVEEQIEELKGLGDLTDKEREIARQIFLAASEETEGHGEKAKAWGYQQAARRLFQDRPAVEPGREFPEASDFAPGEKHLSPLTGQSALSGSSFAGSRSTGGLFPILKQPRVRWAVSGLALFFLAMVVISGLAKNYGNGEPGERKGEKATAKTNKPARPFLSSPALDHVVLGPRELGFHLFGSDDDEEQKARFARSVENQLMGLRQFYRDASAEQPELMGTMVLQMAIDSSGAVARVQETASRIQDRDFRSGVAEEARKWNFAGFLGPARVEFPLLFVPAGMDMTTLIKWEKAQGLLKHGPEGPRTASTSSAPPSPPQERPAAQGKASAEPKAKSRAVETYRVRTMTSLRREPRFSAPPVEKLEPGTQVRVLAVRGEWLEVQSRPGAPAGFIRREYAIPLAKGARKQS